MILSQAKRLISLLLAFFLAVEPCVYSSPEPSEIKSPPSSLILPDELGRVEDYFAPSLSSQNGFPPVIHIQDAHSSPEAQQKIRDILVHLAGLRPSQPLLVALEGSLGSLHPEYLGENETAVQELLQGGILSGAELFAWEEYLRTSLRAERSNDRKAHFIGVETPELYRENLQVYRDFFRNDAPSLKLLRDFRNQWVSTRTKLLNPELRKFIYEVERRREGQFDSGKISPNLYAYLPFLAASVFSHLKIDLRDRFEQIRFPHFTRLLFLIHFEKKISRRQKSILQSEIYPKKLFQEVFFLEQQIRQKLVRSDSEREFLEAFDDFKLLEKLLRFELTEEEYEIISQNVERIHPENLRKRLSFLTPSPPPSPQRGEGKARDYFPRPQRGRGQGEGGMNAAFHTALRFYELAKLRDARLLENSLREAKQIAGSGKIPTLVLITGGFHTEGLIAQMKEKNIPHLVITPRITQSNPSPGRYQELLSGKWLSSGSFFESSHLAWTRILTGTSRYPLFNDPREQRRVLGWVRSQAVPSAVSRRPSAFSVQREALKEGQEVTHDAIRRTQDETPRAEVREMEEKESLGVAGPSFAGNMIRDQETRAYQKDDSKAGQHNWIQLIFPPLRFSEEGQDNRYNKAYHGREPDGKRPFPPEEVTDKTRTQHDLGKIGEHAGKAPSSVVSKDSVHRATQFKESLQKSQEEFYERLNRAEVRADGLEVFDKFINNPWMVQFYLPPENRKELKRAAEAAFTLDHPLKEKVLKKVLALSDEKVLRQADQAVDRETWYKKFAFHTGFNRRISLKEMFLSDLTVPYNMDHNLVQIIGHAVMTADPKVLPRSIRREGEEEVAQRLEMLYLLYRAIEILSRQSDLVLIEDRDIEFLLYNINHTYQEEGKIKGGGHSLLERLLALSRLLIPIDSPQNQISVRNLLVLIEKLEASHPAWKKTLELARSIRPEKYRQYLAAGRIPVWPKILELKEILASASTRMRGVEVDEGKGPWVERRFKLGYDFHILPYHILRLELVSLVNRGIRFAIFKAEEAGAQRYDGSQISLPLGLKKDTEVILIVLGHPDEHILNPIADIVKRFMIDPVFSTRPDLKSETEKGRYEGTIKALRRRMAETADRMALVPVRMDMEFILSRPRLAKSLAKLLSWVAGYGQTTLAFRKEVEEIETTIQKSSRAEVRPNLGARAEVREIRDSSELRHDSRQRASKWSRPESQRTFDTGDRREPPTRFVSPGSSSPEEKDDAGFGKAARSVYPSFSESKRGVSGRIDESSRRQKPSRMKRGEKTLKRPVAEDTAPSFVPDGSPFHLLPTPRPEVRLAQVELGPRLQEQSKTQDLLHLRGRQLLQDFGNWFGNFNLSRRSHIGTNDSITPLPKQPSLRAEVRQTLIGFGTPPSLRRSGARAEVRDQKEIDIHEYLKPENFTKHGPWRDIASPIVFRFVNSFVGRSIDIDDLYQEALLSLLELKQKVAAGKITVTTNPEGYLRQVIGNRFLGLLKKQRARKMIQQGDRYSEIDLNTIIAHNMDEKERIEWEDEIIKLMDLTMKLPEDNRLMVLAVMAELHDGAQLNEAYKNISEKTQTFTQPLTAAAVKTRFWRGRQKLIKLWGVKPLREIGIPIYGTKRAEVRTGKKGAVNRVSGRGDGGIEELQKSRRKIEAKQASSVSKWGALFYSSFFGLSKIQQPANMARYMIHPPRNKDNSNLSRSKDPIISPTKAAVPALVKNVRSELRRPSVSSSMESKVPESGFSIKQKIHISYDKNSYTLNRAFPRAEVRSQAFNRVNPYISQIADAVFKLATHIQSQGFKGIVLSGGSAPFLYRLLQNAWEKSGFAEAEWPAIFIFPPHENQLLQARLAIGLTHNAEKREALDEEAGIALRQLFPGVVALLEEKSPVHGAGKLGELKGQKVLFADDVSHLGSKSVNYRKILRRLGFTNISFASVAAFDANDIRSHALSDEELRGMIASIGANIDMLVERRKRDQEDPRVMFGTTNYETVKALTVLTLLSAQHGSDIGIGGQLDEIIQQITKAIPHLRAEVRHQNIGGQVREVEKQELSSTERFRKSFKEGERAEVRKKLNGRIEKLENDPRIRGRLRIGFLEEGPKFAIRFGLPEAHAEVAMEALLEGEKIADRSPLWLSRLGAPSSEKIISNKERIVFVYLEEAAFGLGLAASIPATLASYGQNAHAGVVARVAFRPVIESIKKEVLPEQKIVQEEKLNELLNQVALLKPSRLVILRAADDAYFSAALVRRLFPDPALQIEVRTVTQADLEWAYQFIPGLVERINALRREIESLRTAA